MAGALDYLGMLGPFGMMQAEGVDAARKAAARARGLPVVKQATPFDALINTLQGAMPAMAAPDMTGGAQPPRPPAAQLFAPPQQRTAPRPGPAPAAQAFAPAAPLTGQDPFSRFAHAIDMQETGGKYGIPNAEGSGAMGRGQLMPDTAKGLAAKLGIPYRPDLQSGSSPEARAYQDQLYKASLQEDWEFGKGDPALAAAHHFAGPNQKGWGPKTQRYVQDIQGRMATGGTAMPQFQGSFNPQYWNQALGAVNAGDRAQRTPFETNIPMPAAPDFPDAPVMPKRDFGKTDELMQGMKPVLDLEASRPRIERANLFAGLAKGLASIPDGAGLGAVLGQLGAGLLAGRAAADGELQKRIDAFDAKMEAWKQAEFNYEGAKASTLHEDAVKEVGMMYQHNLNKFSADTQAFTRDHDVQIMGNQFVIRNRTDAGMQVKTVPIGPMIEAATSMQRAQLFGQVAGAQQQSSAMQAGANNQILAGVFANNYARDQAVQANAPGGLSDTAAQGFMTSAGLQATELITSGMAPQVLGDEAYAKAAADAAKRAQTEGLFAGQEGYDKRIRELMVGDLTLAMISKPQLMEQVRKVAPVLYQQYMSRTVTRKTTRDNRGRASVSETFDGE